MAQARRHAIIIVGMPCNGASVLARVLNLLGVKLPKDFSPPNSSELGYWNSAKLTSLNDAMFQSAGSHWSNIFGIDPSWFESPASRQHRDAVIDFVRMEFEKASLFAVNDPRAAMFVPIWRQALEVLEIEPSFILPFRNVFEVGSSLQRHQRLFEPDSAWAAEKAPLLWLRYILTAEQQTRDVPRAFMSMDSFLDSWVSEVQRLAEQLSLAWPNRGGAAREITELLQRETQSQDTAAVPEAVHANSQWLGQVLGQLEACVEAPQSGDTVFDAAQKALEEGTRLFGSYVQALERSAVLASDPDGTSSAAQRLWHEYNHKIRQLEGRLNILTLECERYAERIRKFEGEAEDKLWSAMPDTAAELERCKALVLASQSNARAAEATIDELQHINEATEIAFSQLGQQLSRASRMLGQLLRQLHEQSTLRNDAQQELDEAYATVTQTLDEIEQDFELFRTQDARISR